LRRITKPLAALALASALFLAPAAPAFAGPEGTVTPGAFCKEKEQGTHGHSTDGDEYVCEKRGDDKTPRWYPVNPQSPPGGQQPGGQGPGGPPANPGTGGGAPAKPPAGGTAPGGTAPGGAKQGGTTKQTVVDKTGQDTDSLPVTGNNTPYQVGGGILLLALGGGLVLVTRRRRATRFTA
jgi:LPXTG-motif cell wall-anchored protein